MYIKNTSQPGYYLIYLSYVFQLLFLGDSNNRAHYYFYVAFTNCRQVKAPMKKKWHAPLLCINDEMNFSVEWDPHSQPFLAHKVS